MLAVGASPAAASPFDHFFGTGGVAVGPGLPGQQSRATSLTLVPDGEIMFGGWASGDPSNPTAPFTVRVGRMWSDGNLDPSFGHGTGQVSVGTFIGGRSVAVPGDSAPVEPIVKMLLAPGGDVLVLGGGLTELNYVGGDINRLFGTDGYAPLPPAFAPETMAVQPDGNIVLAGVVSQAGQVSGAVVRVTAAGAVDPNFGRGGLATLPPVSDPEGHPVTAMAFRGVAVDGNHDIEVAAVADAAAADPRLAGVTDHFPVVTEARLLDDGTLDPSFGTAGQSVQGDVSGFEPSTLTLTGGGGAIVGQQECNFGVTHICIPTVASFGPVGQVLSQPASPVICSPCYPAVGSLSRVASGGWLLVQAQAAPGAAVGTDRLGNDSQVVLTPFSAALQPLPVAQARAASVYYTFAQATVTLPAGATTEGVSVLQPDEQLLVAGSGTAADGTPGMMVARLNPLSDLRLGPSPLPVIHHPPQRVVVRIDRAGVVRRPGHIGVELSCTGNAACHGDLVLYVSGRVHGRRRPVGLGYGYYSLAPGHTARFPIPLNAAGRARLAPGRSWRASLRLITYAGGVTTATIVVPAARR